MCLEVLKGGNKRGIGGIGVMRKRKYKSTVEIFNNFIFGVLSRYLTGI